MPHWIKGFDWRLPGILIFGILIPVLILFQAYFGLSSSLDNVSESVKSGTGTALFNEASEKLVTGNDYVLFSLIYTENANQQVVTNKQIMKLSVMQIGFAVISLGLMFVILGFSDGGASGQGQSGGLSFSFSTGSTGLAVVVIGALMATEGGVLKNDYSTVPIPSYLSSVSSSGGFPAQQAYSVCTEKAGEEVEACFLGLFKQYFKVR